MSGSGGRIRRGDPAYPACLDALHDPPTQLFVRGVAPALLGRPAVAVVGSRSCSGYGRSVATSIGRALAAAGIVVVSGLAQGIDAAAHRGALEASGSTLAVLGCGIDLDYPIRNRALAAEIRTNGLIVSEYPAVTAPARWRFPARNRNGPVNTENPIFHRVVGLAGCCGFAWWCGPGVVPQPGRFGHLALEALGVD